MSAELVIYVARELDPRQLKITQTEREECNL